MSEENVQAFKRLAKAGTRFDAEAILQDTDANVEWHPVMPALLGGARTAYRRHEGVRELMRDFGESFAEARMEFTDIRELDDGVLGLGVIRAVGKESGAVTESPFGYVVKFKNGKATYVRAYLDHREALEAAGLSE